MKTKNHKEIISHIQKNSNYGVKEVYYERTENPYKIKIKGGYSTMYINEFQRVQEEVINSKKELKLFNWVLKKFNQNNTEVPLRYEDCKKSISVSKPTYVKIIKRMTEEKLLKRISRGIYRLNPYIYIPYNVDGVELQYEWNKLEEEEIKK